MALVDYRKCPFPWFGGKSHASPFIWDALGDVPHFVDPFAGSLAVLLNRPHECNRPYYSETVNDLDGLLINAWRSIQLKPDATAEAASNPVAEADLHARHCALLRWRAEHELEHLMGDPLWCDPLMAGWWLWGCASWIGSGWCSGDGPWIADATGRLVKQSGTGNGVSRQLPHISSDGQGVNRPQLREPGVSRKLPYLGDDGRGVNRPQLREPGVSRKLPHLGNNGQGVNHAGLREPGVWRQRPHLTDDGRGVNHAGLREPDTEDDGGEFHPVTMPELRRWFHWLSARLRHVRILNGDWRRAVTTGAALTLPVRQGHGPCGIMLDPPYANSAGRDPSLYTHDSGDVAHAVREWAIATGTDPRYRIVLAGFEGEHGTAFTDAGWREVEWFKAGFLTGGMGNQNEDGHQQGRERLWMSPHCLVPAVVNRTPLFDLMGADEE